MKTKILIALITVFLGFSVSGEGVMAQTTTNVCTSGTMTLAQAKYAITQGGYDTGIILGTRNASGILEIDPRTGDGVVKNDTDCSLPISIASYKIDDPSDPDIRMQTFFAASVPNTIVPPHSSRTLHVNLPPCDFQADFFYADNYPRGKADRYVKVDGFLDAGYVVSIASKGGIACPTTSPVTPITPPTTIPIPISFSISCPAIPERARLYEQVSRSVSIYGGIAPFQIRWSGTDDLFGTENSITKIYTTPGQKNTLVTVTDARGQTQSAQCNIVIVDQPYQPPVQPQVIQLPPPPPPLPPMQYVALAETPYTGLNDYPLPTLFAVISMVWTALIVGYIVYKRYYLLNLR